MRYATSLVGLICLLPVSAAYAQPPGTCELESLQHQQRDAATIQHLEASWYLAITHGDMEFESCLLTADFMSIFPGGALKARADELRLTAKNKGQNRSVQPLPKFTVLRHDGVAVAYATWTPTGGAVKPGVIADYFVWENGRWRVFFSQETPVGGDPTQMPTRLRLLP